MSQLASDPKDLLNQGAARAKNMGVAVVMIAFLLSKYFGTKVLWKPMERMLATVIVRSATVMARLYAQARPHIEQLRVRAVHSTNQVMRLFLGVLIQALTPLEAMLLRFFGVARTQSEKLAVKSSQSIFVVIASVLRAFGAAVQAGLSKPAMQRAMNRLFELVEEAQKA